MQAIGRALAAYRRDHQGNLPPHLSDLYPKYLTDKGLLLCPADPNAGSESTDPELPCDYHYDNHPGGLLLGPGKKPRYFGDRRVG